MLTTSSTFFLAVFPATALAQSLFSSPRILAQTGWDGRLNSSVVSVACAKAWNNYALMRPKDIENNCYAAYGGLQDEDLPTVMPKYCRDECLEGKRKYAQELVDGCSIKDTKAIASMANEVLPKRTARTYRDIVRHKLKEVAAEIAIRKVEQDFILGHYYACRKDFAVKNTTWCYSYEFEGISEVPYPANITNTECSSSCGVQGILVEFVWDTVLPGDLTDEPIPEVVESGKHPFNVRNLCKDVDFSKFDFVSSGEEQKILSSTNSSLSPTTPISINGTSTHNSTDNTPPNNTNTASTSATSSSNTAGTSSGTTKSYSFTYPLVLTLIALSFFSL